MKPKALIFSGYGINCERETAAAVELAGGQALIAHAKEWLQGTRSLGDVQLLIFPGGFSFGDELGAAQAFANRILFAHKREELHQFVQNGHCILGICNGFQVLVKLGLLPGLSSSPEAALIRNQSQRFEARWTRLRALSPHCIFTRGLAPFELPIRHGEGRFIAPPSVLQRLLANGQVALQYLDNPNGSLEEIAGLSDPTGRILGLMPHPEAATHFTQLPRWTRHKKPHPRFGPGLDLFRNAIRYLESS